ALLAAQCLIYFVGSQRLIPINVAWMGRLFVKTLEGVAVKNRPAEGRALDRISIAAPRDVAPSQDKFEFRLADRPGFAEHRDRASAESADLFAVVLDLLHHALGI